MLAASALLTSVNFFSLRMRPGLFVPIKWRLPECPRLILPFAVNLKRFLAPRWVFNFNFGFDLFLGITGNPLLTLNALRVKARLEIRTWVPTGAQHAAPPQILAASLITPVTNYVRAFDGADYCDCWALDDVCPAGLATLTPFFGASNATKTFPSMRGMVSIWPWSPISMSKRFILARPTSWWAISRPR